MSSSFGHEVEAPKPGRRSVTTNIGGWLRDRKSIVGEARGNMRYESIWMEMSGALGDLGTFVPIVVALALANGLDLGTTLIFTGAYNIITGIGFGVPMPVQPMKTIAAVAISERLTLPEIMAAGITTSASSQA